MGSHLLARVESDWNIPVEGSRRLQHTEAAMYQTAADFH
jgi:hypothetical protein